jgi:glycine/D-amino acid oxidase-like deaminating enzyme
VFPEILQKKLFVPRREVFFFGTPPGDDRFTYPNFPNFCEEEAADFYGFSSIDDRGFKVCPTGEKTVFDPDSDDRVVTQEQIQRARDYLSRRLPALKDQPLVEARVCQLEMSVDEHFIIDRHPEYENVWIAGGGSGHGFKHGPMIGEYVANRVTGRDCNPEYETAFRLKAHTFG